MLVKPLVLHYTFDDLPLLEEIHADEYIRHGCKEHGGVCYENDWILYLKITRDQNEISFVPFLRNDIDGHSINEHIGANYIVSIKNANGGTVQETKFDHNAGEECEWKQLIKCSTITDEDSNILKDGTLHVDVTIQVKDKSDELCEPDENERHQQMMLDLLDNGEKADMPVNIGGELFDVHSLILENNAPILAAYCKQIDSNDAAGVGIPSKVFRMILEYVYAGCRPKDPDIVDFGKELLDAANRFELVEFKLAIEKVLVRERIIDKENVADFIVFADAKSCPLLKEYAITFFLLHAKEILKSDHSKCLRESGQVLSEIMMLMVDPEEGRMTVNELRTELKKRKLDIDGSKEALMSRLEEAKRQRTEEESVV